MSVRIRVLRIEIPLIGKNLRNVCVYSDEFDCDRSLSEFFTNCLPFLASSIAESVIIPPDGLFKSILRFDIEYGANNLFKLRNEVSE